MKDYSLGYEDGYVDVKRGRYEEPVGTAEYNRGYAEGAQARRDFEARTNQTRHEWEQHERQSLRRGLCPHSGNPLLVHDDGLARCSVCDCFGIEPPS